MELIPDDPIVARMMNTGYGFREYETGRYYETPDGDMIPEDSFTDYVLDWLREDPQGVAELLGCTLRGFEYGF